MPQTATPDTAAAVLEVARVRRAMADRAEAEQLQAAVDWAAMHSVDSLIDAALAHDGYDDRGLPIAGEGAPLVAEFAITEFALAVGLSTDAGNRYVGQAVELRYRLPKVWARVCSGDLVAWKARRIADATMSLVPEGAAFVDRHVAAVAHKIGVAALDRLIEEARVRFQPEDAEQRRRAAADGRCFEVDTDQVSYDGTMQIRGELDIADAMDLDAAVAAGAEAQRVLGSEDSLGARRAKAVADLARQQLAFDLNTQEDEPTTTDSDATPGQRGGSDSPPPPDQPRSSSTTSDSAAPTRGTARRPRQVVLYVHLSHDALRTRHLDGGRVHLARVENSRSFVSVDQVRGWCATPDAQVTVKPVIDLEDHVHVNAYEVPDRLVERVALINHTCVFPWCTRPARKLKPDGHRADCDHVREHSAGGATCSCNIAPLCRRHHRHKTHSPWSYTVIDPGTFLWTSPQGYQYLRDHTGTLDVTRDRARAVPPPDE
ncbi:HNH endonuclease signature motif containing protein [Nocardioides pacificus]